MEVAAPGPMLDAAELDVAAIQAAVREALRGRRSLQEVMHEALFGGEWDPAAEPDWGQWPEHAVLAWDAAVTLYREKAGLTAVRRMPPVSVSLSEGWDAVEGAVPHGHQFPELPDVTYADMPTPPGVSTRAMTHALTKKHGWEFSGRGPARRADLAPCISCGTPVPVAEIRARRCRACRTRT